MSRELKMQKKYSPGKRFASDRSPTGISRLVVVQLLPTTDDHGFRIVQVKCDCGRWEGEKRGATVADGRTWQCDQCADEQAVVTRGEKVSGFLEPPNANIHAALDEFEAAVRRETHLEIEQKENRERKEFARKSLMLRT